MKAIHKVILLTSLFTVSVWAHNRPDNPNNKGKQETNMMEMNGHKGKLQSQIENIKKENPSEKRQMMMHEHMQSMQQGMLILEGQMGGADMKNIPMDTRMDMMQSQMNMMQMMMGQMLEHNAIKDGQEDQ